jgi:hypothetical protein
MDAAVYDLPFASVPTRKPRTPMEVPMPDLDRFSLSGPSLMLLRNRQAMFPQFYPRQRAAIGLSRLQSNRANFLILDISRPLLSAECAAEFARGGRYGGQWR